MESDALKAMFNHIESLNILPVFFPNISFDTDGNELPTDDHFKVFIIPIDPDSNITTCGNKARYQWLLQVSVFIRDGVGQIKSAEYIDQLRSNINNGLVLTENSKNFRVVGVGKAATAKQQDGWYSVPVTFTIEIIE